MPKNKKINKKEDKDERMIADYFKYLKKYQLEFGMNTILLWQCGGFYEIYTPKNEVTGEYLNTCFENYLKITYMNVANKNLSIKWDDGITYPVKMAGFTHADYLLEKWVKILTDNGYTVAVWEENGTVPGSTKKTRALDNIYSPGCNFSVEKKDTDTNNIACYVINKSSGFHNKNPTIYFGCSVIDAFTGVVKIFEHHIQKQDIHNTTVFDELERFNAIYNPSEIVIIHNYTEERYINDIIQYADLDTKSIHIINQNNNDEHSIQANNCDNQTYQKEIILKFYEDINDFDSYMESSQLSQNPFALKSLCFLLDFIWQHNANLTNKLQRPKFDNISNRLLLANHSLRQLNIVSIGGTKGKHSSVEALINKCVTPMGRRYLKDKILHPVTDISYLNEQYNMIEYLIENWNKYEFLRKSFQAITDIEHLYRKIIFNKISPNDLYNFNTNLHCIQDIHQILKQDKIMMKYIENNIGTNIEEVCSKLISLLERYLNMEICSTLLDNKFEQNFINRDISGVLDQVSDEFDEINNIKTKWLSTITSLLYKVSDRKATNVIKVHTTEKNGMYFYATTARCKGIQENLTKHHKKNKYIVNGLDFSTFKPTAGAVGGNKKLLGNDLKNFYDKYGQKLDNMREILTNVYTEFIISLREYNNEMNDFVKYVSNLDMLITKAFVSKNNNYCKPVIKNKAKKSFIDAKDIRHPLIEKIQINETYVPNDVSIGKKKDGMLIFGTNGVGKSSINRSVGISVIMAQAGMFVPCSSFTYKPYTAIYTRILGNDNIFKGLSTFTVEMSEVSTFINNCDENSLILGDEVCSGTETSSAVSIFAEVLLWLNKKGASHIFASHFHQLTTMKEITTLKKLAIKHMSVTNINGVLYYTRKLEDGPGENMYGIEVCKSFDFPDEFIQETYKLRNKYNKKLCGSLKKKKSSYNSKKLKGNCEFCKREGVDIHHLEPQEKADVNNWIKTFHKNHPANLANICKECHLDFTKNKTVHRNTKTTGGYKLVEQ
jgi:DNA mismatch repair protein MutS